MRQIHAAPSAGGATKSTRIEMTLLPLVSRIALAVVTLGYCLSFTVPALAADYAGAISAYRRAHGLSAVTLDSRLDAVARRQAQAMAASGTVSHSVGGIFTMRVANLRKAIAAENIGAGFLTFSEMLRQWEASAGHRENLLIPQARRVGVAFVDNPRSPYRKFWAMVITN
jgi:uncharacterized protein YkwD